jgi:hypothetical protein
MHDFSLSPSPDILLLFGLDQNGKTECQSATSHLTETGTDSLGCEGLMLQPEKNTETIC